MGVSKHTIYVWEAKYGGMDVSQAQEAKQLRDENTKLRKLAGGPQSGQRSEAVGDPKKTVVARSAEGSYPAVDASTRHTFSNNRRVLHLAQPIRQNCRIKSEAGGDAKRLDSANLRQQGPSTLLVSYYGGRAFISYLLSLLIIDS